MGRLIPRAKINDDQVYRILQGFACAESIAEISAAIGISQKTCRSILLALRYRLFREAYKFWRIKDDALLIHPVKQADKVEAIILIAYARCYYNDNCYSNFMQGLTQSRLCRDCPIRAISDPDDDLAADLHRIDTIYSFYRMLGIGGESGLLPLTIFRLRWAHTAVVGHAYEDTRKLEDGAPDFVDENIGAARHLFNVLCEDLQAEPLDRSLRPVDEIDIVCGDLTVDLS